MEFHFLQTDDGSPSLKLGPEAEAMHSSKGAFSETTYIYGNAISTCLRSGFSPSFLSLGLGLGYNELLTTALLLKHDTDLTKVRGLSFELVPELNANFRAWLFNEELETKFQETYETICSLCARETLQEPQKIKLTLANLINDSQWLLNGALSEETKVVGKISCFLFDAFSSKTSPELWNESFIDSFLKSTAGEKAILSTYACTGSLKRALVKNNFKVEIRPGFAGKRESIIAIRGAN